MNSEAQMKYLFRRRKKEIKLGIPSLEGQGWVIFNESLEKILKVE